MSEFKAGDQVEYSITKTIGEFVKYIDSPCGHCLVDFGLSDMALLLVRNIKHVNKQEENLGDDSHIENHISPNCKVTEVHINEAYKLNRLG